MWVGRLEASPGWLPAQDRRAATESRMTTCGYWRAKCIHLSIRAFGVNALTKMGDDRAYDLLLSVH